MKNDTIITTLEAYLATPYGATRTEIAERAGLSVPSVCRAMSKPLLATVEDLRHILDVRTGQIQDLEKLTEELRGELFLQQVSPRAIPGCEACKEVEDLRQEVQQLKVHLGMALSENAQLGADYRRLENLIGLRTVRNPEGLEDVA